MLRIVLLIVSLLAVLTGSPTLGTANPSTSTKTAALPSDKLAEKERNQAVIDMSEKRWGVIVLPVTEDIKKELNLRSAEGVAVMDIIGDSLGEKAGIKVGAVITEINKIPVRNLDDLGRLLPEALEKGNFTVGTWEPTNPENQGQGGQMNFHFVPKETD